MKDELMDEVWSNLAVEESNLTQNISVLRKALGESSRNPQYIETVPRRGYRFIASVKQVQAGDGQLFVGPWDSVPTAIEQEETIKRDEALRPESEESSIGGNRETEAAQANEESHNFNGGISSRPTSPPQRVIREFVRRRWGR